MNYPAKKASELLLESVKAFGTRRVLLGYQLVLYQSEPCSFPKLDGGRFRNVNVLVGQRSLCIVDCWQK